MKQRVPRSGAGASDSPPHRGVYPGHRGDEAVRAAVLVAAMLLTVGLDSESDQGALALSLDPPAGRGR